jgi:hypothetical protein
MRRILSNTITAWRWLGVRYAARYLHHAWRAAR